MKNRKLNILTLLLLGGIDKILQNLLLRNISILSHFLSILKTFELMYPKFGTVFLCINLIVISIIRSHMSPGIRNWRSKKYVLLTNRKVLMWAIRVKLAI